MKRLYFVRHGESELNRAKKWAGLVDTPLTMKGHTQAMHTGKHMQQQGLAMDVIISSPLERAHNTAKHIASHIDYPHESIVVHPGFVERDYGKLDGRKNRIVTMKRRLTGETALDKVEGSEKMTELQKRADEMLEYLHTLPYDTILVVAHGTFGRALRRAVNNDPIHHEGARIQNAELIRFI